MFDGLLLSHCCADLRFLINGGEIYHLPRGKRNKKFMKAIFKLIKNYLLAGYSLKNEVKQAFIKLT